MNLQIPITQTLKLDYCWVCGIENAPYEEHHIVPRHCGGANGPTVTLCGGCHSTIHLLADQVKNGNPITNYKKQISRERSLYLATVIANSELLIQISPENKRFVYSGFFTGEVHTKLVRLTKFYKMSQHKVLVLALDELFKRNFE